MAVRPIIFADNPRLRQKSRKVRVFGPTLETVVADMLETLGAANGLGLAAPQIDVLEQVVVITLPEDEEDPQSGKTYVLVNPEIVRAQGAEEGEEGCLSVPGYVGEVERSSEVLVRGLDEHGDKFRLRPRDFLARVFQHEIDHVNGILYIDHLVAPDRIWEVEPGTEEQTELKEQQNVRQPASA